MISDKFFHETMKAIVYILLLTTIKYLVGFEGSVLVGIALVASKVDPYKP